MAQIPTVNIVAAIHLYLIGGLAACGFIEIVFEYYALFFNRRLHACAIRFHHWIDIFVEIPLLTAVVISGICLAFLVENLSALHFIKIGLAVCMVTGSVICFVATFRRSRMLDENAPEEALIGETRRMMVRNVIIVGMLAISVFAIGLWLAYHRIVEYYM